MLALFKPAAPLGGVVGPPRATGATGRIIAVRWATGATGGAAPAPTAAAPTADDATRCTYGTRRRARRSLRLAGSALTVNLPLARVHHLHMHNKCIYAAA